MSRHPAFPLLVLMTVTACSATDSTTLGATCAGPKTYAVGSTLNGTTVGANCRKPGGSNDGPTGELYNMTLTQQSNFFLTLEATGYPGFVGLYTSSGDVIDEEGISNTQLKAFLPAGTYQVYVGDTKGAGGAFTLTSPSTSLDGCTTINGGGVNLGHIVKGASFSGTVVATDCGNTLAKIDIYEIRVKAGEVLNLSITVDRLSGLSVVNAGGAVVASRELTAAGSWTTAVTATTAGSYLIRIESRTANGSSNLPVAYSVVLN